MSFLGGNPPKIQLFLLGNLAKVLLSYLPLNEEAKVLVLMICTEAAIWEAWDRFPQGDLNWSTADVERN